MFVSHSFPEPHLQFTLSALSTLKQYLDHQLEGMSSTCWCHKVTPPAGSYVRDVVNTTKANACDCAVCTQFPVLCSETGNDVQAIDVYVSGYQRKTHCALAKSDRLLLTCGRPQFQFADRMLPDKFISKRWRGAPQAFCPMKDSYRKTQNSWNQNNEDMIMYYYGLLKGENLNTETNMAYGWRVFGRKRMINGHISSMNVNEFVGWISFLTVLASIVWTFWSWTNQSLPRRF